MLDLSTADVPIAIEAIRFLASATMDLSKSRPVLRVVIPNTRPFNRTRGDWSAFKVGRLSWASSVLIN